jgi:hypothetical protein
MERGVPCLDAVDAERWRHHVFVLDERGRPSVRRDAGVFKGLQRPGIVADPDVVLELVFGGPSSSSSLAATGVAKDPPRASARSVPADPASTPLRVLKKFCTERSDLFSSGFVT